MNVDDTWDRARNLLAVRLDSMGDVLMTTPALRALSRSAGGRRVSLLTSPAGAQIAALVPDIDQVIVCEVPWMKATPMGANARDTLAMVDRLRTEQFDGAVIFTVFSQNPLPAALVCYLAEIPRRLAHCHENPYQLLTNWVPDPEPVTTIRHEVRRQLDLVATIGSTSTDEGLCLRVPPDARCRMEMLLSQIGVRGSRPWVVIHSGATAPSRRYPLAGFAEVGRCLSVDHGCQVVLTGSEAERPQVQQIQEEMSVPSFSLAGRLTLAELAALIELAPVLISNNSGPVHIAAAVNTPVVDIYALTNPQHTPWAVAHRVLSYDVPCKNCFKSVCPEGHHRCLRMISPESIVQAALGLMHEREDLRRHGTAYCPSPEEYR